MDAKLKAAIERIKQTRRCGMIAGAEPLPKENGFIVQRCMLDDTPITAKFDQQPPKGSQRIPQPPKPWSGYLLFLDPNGEIWKVPNIWYNRTWQDRIDELQSHLQKTEESLNRERETVTRIEEMEAPSKSDIWRKTEAQFLIRQYVDNQNKLRTQIEFIKNYAKLHGHPCLDPLPDLKIKK